MWLQFIWYYQFVTSVCIASVCVSLVCMMTAVDWHHQSLWCHQFFALVTTLLSSFITICEIWVGLITVQDYLISGWLIKFWKICLILEYLIWFLMLVVVFCLLFWGLIFFRVYGINISPLLLVGPKLVLLLYFLPWTCCFSFLWFAINWL